MSKLIGHVDIELVRIDEAKTKILTIQGEEFLLEDGGEPLIKDGETSTWYLFK